MPFPQISALSWKHSRQCIIPASTQATFAQEKNSTFGVLRKTPDLWIKQPRSVVHRGPKQSESLLPTSMKQPSMAMASEKIQTAVCREKNANKQEECYCNCRNLSTRSNIVYSSYFWLRVRNLIAHKVLVTRSLVYL